MFIVLLPGMPVPIPAFAGTGFFWKHFSFPKDGF